MSLRAYARLLGRAGGKERGRIALLFALSLGCLVAFVLWSWLVQARALISLDRAAALRLAQHTGPAADRFAQAGAALFGLYGIVALAASGVLMLLAARHGRLALLLILALLTAGIAERGLRTLLTQPAPASVRAASYTRTQRPSSGLPVTAVAPRVALPVAGLPSAERTYPSGHATLAGALFGAFVVAAVLLRRGWCFTLALVFAGLALWACWAELYRGEHVLSDVVGGTLLGVVIPAVIAALTPWNLSGRGRSQSR